MMNEKEWAEFFELVNGRKPEIEDFQKAREAGEYSPSAPMDVTAKPETPLDTNEAIQEQVTPEVTNQEPMLESVAEANPAGTTTAAPQAQQVTAPATADTQVPVATPQSATQAQGFAQVPAAPAKPKTSVFKKVGKVFKSKNPNKKGLPLWLNIVLSVLVVLVLVGLGIGGHAAQKKVTQKDVTGDWQLSETAYYKDGDWETYFKDGKFTNNDDKRASKYIKYYYFLSKRNGELSFYNYMTDGSDTLAFSNAQKPAVTFNTKKESQSIDSRIDDDYAYVYYPNQDYQDSDLSLGDYKAKYFIKDDELTIVYYDHGDPYYKETYKSLSATQAKKARQKAKKYYQDFESYVNDVYDYYYGDGDSDDSSSSDSNSDRDAFQVG